MEGGSSVRADVLEVVSRHVQLVLVEPVLVVAGFQQLVAEAAIPIGKLELGADVLTRLLLLQCPFLPQVCAHDRVEVAVRLGASGHGGRWRAIELSGSVLICRLWDGFYALQVSLTLLQSTIIRSAQTYPAADGGLTFSCLSRLSLRRCLPFSWGLAVRGTKAVYHESASYILAQFGCWRGSCLWTANTTTPASTCRSSVMLVGVQRMAPVWIGASLAVNCGESLERH